MAFSAQDLAKLHRIVFLAQKLIAASPKPKRGRPATSNANGSANRASGKRIRRTGKELVQFRKMLKAERKKGIPVAEMSRKHGISSAYIYTLP
jgi:hypothetical protein